MTSRSADKAEKAVQDVLAVVPKANIKIISLDLTDFASIKQAAEHFTSTSSRLDLLINNAGVMAMPYSHTKQNYDIQFGTNHLGHALSVKLLLPTLLESSIWRVTAITLLHQAVSCSMRKRPNKPAQARDTEAQNWPTFCMLACWPKDTLNLRSLPYILVSSRRISTPQ
jgi:NAD(P)-dependent dehydrogenase (short-subunit alcohol dehydrogenase family)